MKILTGLCPSNGGGAGDWNKFTSRIDSFAMKFFAKTSCLVLKSSISLQKTSMGRWECEKPTKTEDFTRETIRRRIVISATRPNSWYPNITRFTSCKSPSNILSLSCETNIASEKVSNRFGVVSRENCNVGNENTLSNSGQIWGPCERLAWEIWRYKCKIVQDYWLSYYKREAF